jgi:hypothetical protein
MIITNLCFLFKEAKKIKHEKVFFNFLLRRKILEEFFCPSLITKRKICLHILQAVWLPIDRFWCICIRWRQKLCHCQQKEICFNIVNRRRRRRKKNEYSFVTSLRNFFFLSNQSFIFLMNNWRSLKTTFSFLFQEP